MAGILAMRATTSSMFAAEISSGSIGVAGSVTARPVRIHAALHAALCAGLVEDVDGAVGQLVVAQVPRRELGRGLDRIIGVVHAMVPFVAGAEALQDPHGLLNRRFVDDDLLQPARERPVLLDVLELFVRRRTDQAQLPGRQDWLDEGRQVHRAAGRGSGTDGGVDLVDEEDRHRALRERVDDGLEAFLEVAAKARAGEEGTRVEREDFGALEQIRHVVVEEPGGEAFGERRLAHARVADKHRVVLAAPAEDLHRALELVGTANQRIELTGAGSGGQVGRVGGQRVACGGAAALAAAGFGVGRRFAGVGPGGRGWRQLRLSVRDVFEDVEPGDALP